MIRKPPAPPHSLRCPKPRQRSRLLQTGWRSLTHGLLASIGLLSAALASIASAQDLPVMPPSEQAAEQAPELPNWQQWHDASLAAEAMVNDDVHDSGLLPDAIADDTSMGLELDDNTASRYGSGTPWLLRGEPYFIDKVSLSARQIGESSWYGPGFHGRLTASGEVFDMHQLTAAHRTLPLPSYIRVTHLGNKRSVIVKVNDRGPYHGKRMLDISYAAAQALGMQGVAQVSIEAIDQGRTGHLRKGKALGTSEVYRVRLGNFRDANVAHALESRLLAILPKGVGIDVISELEPIQVYRVSVGPMLTRAEAALVVRGLRAQRLGLLMNVNIRPSAAQ